MKKIYFTSILLIMAFAGFSQTEKGSWLLGGSIQYTNSTQTWNSPLSPSEKTSIFALNPKIGFFPANNFAVILNVNYLTGSVEGSSGHSLTIGPALRYYLPASESIKFFLGAGVGFGSGSDNITSTAYQFEAGPAFFISPAVAVELNIGYETQNFKNQGQYGISKQSQFGVGLGFMIYLGGSKSKPAQ